MLIIQLVSIVKWGEKFRIYSGVRQRCIMSPWLPMDVVMKVKMGMGRKEVSFLYADDLVLCG